MTIEELKTEAREDAIREIHKRLKKNSRKLEKVSFSTAMHKIADKETESAFILQSVDETIDIAMHDEDFMNQDFSAAFG
jgi:hypothetical protein